jgi:hypothetical protein
MIENILTKLNFNVDINELHEYYDVLNTKFQHLDWSWDKCGDTIVKQWRDAAYADPANLLTHGWAIQSNLKDITLPCPPWNISTLETTEYRNTELAFGIIERLQAAMPQPYLVRSRTSLMFHSQLIWLSKPDNNLMLDCEANDRLDS